MEFSLKQKFPSGCCCYCCCGKTRKNPSKCEVKQKSPPKTVTMQNTCFETDNRRKCFSSIFSIFRSILHFGSTCCCCFFRDSQRLGSLIIYSSVFLCIWLLIGARCFFLTLPNHICLHSLVFSLPTFASIHSFKSSYRRKFNRESVAFNEINFDSICWNIHELFKAFSHIATYFTFS